MKDKRYLLGLDFGSLSVRCIIADEYGNEIGGASANYPHGVMDKELPSGIKLPQRFALQHPDDYLTSAKQAIRESLDVTKVIPSNIVGLGIDFTASTILAVDENLTPLCMKEEFTNEPHAYVKLWKHYGASEEAEIILALAKKRGEGWLSQCGQYISPEWTLPKIFETLRKAPKVYDATYRFVEAGNWITWLITGTEGHSVDFVGYKSHWNEENGYPSDDFMSSLSPKLSNIVGTKISNKVIATASCAGHLSEKGAELLGLCPGTAVSSAYIDAHAVIPGLELNRPGELIAILGTSAVYIVHSEEYKPIYGVMGCVKDAYLPNLYTYETGQAALGDIFDWFVKNCVPASYEKEADDLQISTHKLLTQKASSLSVGESGLIALDWHNGNRNPLCDSKLSSVMLGINMGTRPEEIYRAWLESTVFGARSIVENLEAGGVPINRIIAAGGIALKNELFMQIFADVFGRDIEVSSSTQAGALGMISFAAVAAGIFPDVVSASQTFAKPIAKVYKPIPDNHEKYEKLYQEYKILTDYFAKGGNDIMKRIGK